jgi:hypothetical protein
LNRTLHHHRARMATAATYAIAVLAVTLGALATSRPSLAVAGGVVVMAAAVAFTASVPLLLATFAAVFISRRVGPPGLDMSVADVTLVVASVVALPWVPWRNRAVRRVGAAIAVYLLVLLVTVVAQPSQRAVFEWAHRSVLLLGSVAVGAAVARLRAGPMAVRVLYAAATVVAVAAVAQGIASGMRPAYPLGLQKNFAGGLLAMTLLVAWVAPAYAELRRTTMLVVQAAVVPGLLATQSRGAMAALVVAMAIWALVTRKRALRFLALVPVAAVMVVLVLASLRSDLERRNDPYSPVTSRRILNQAALVAWSENRVFGAGLRYFKAPGYRYDVPGYRVVVRTEDRKSVV